MPISNLMIATVSADVPKKRVKKSERDFSPPGMSLRPSRFNVARLVYDHYARCREDKDYNLRFEVFVQESAVKRAQDALKWAHKRQGQSDYVPKIRVRASEVKDCARRQAFRLLGFNPAPIGEDSPHWNLAALSGTELHSALELTLKFLGITERAEFNVTSSTDDFAGKVDAKLKDGPAILDIKTVDDKNFKEGAWGSKIPGYIAQISAYARLTGNTIGVILLVNRNNGRLLDIEFDVDSVYADSVLARATEIVESVKNRQLPPAEEYQNGRPTFECSSFCPFLRQCKQQEEDGSIQYALNNGADPKEL